ncbi:MAG: OmpH family outer membrane protein [Chromatiales bacterium]|jgi:outer membrane protein
MGLVAVALILASASAAAEELRIGFVNIPKLMDQSPQKEAAGAMLEKRFAPRDAELADQREAIRKLEEQLERDGAVMAASKRADLEKEIRERTRDFKRSSDDYKEDVNIARNEELAKLQREVLEAIVEISRQENYDLVLADSVIFASNRVDFTDQVLEYLRKQFEASGNKSR